MSAIRIYLPGSCTWHYDFDGCWAMGEARSSQAYPNLTLAVDLILWTSTHRLNRSTMLFCWAQSLTPLGWIATRDHAPYFGCMMTVSPALRNPSQVYDKPNHSGYWRGVLTAHCKAEVTLSDRDRFAFSESLPTGNSEAIGLLQIW